MALDSRTYDRGPIPGSVAISRKAEAAADENMLVTWGTDEGSCKVLGATEEVMGWSAGKQVEDQQATIYPVSCAGIWKCKVSSGSTNIYDGETVEAAGSGEVKNSVSGSGNTIVGKAMSDGTASGYVLVMPMVATPTAATS